MDGTDRVTIEVEVERALAERARAAGLDLSAVTERALHRSLGSDDPAAAEAMRRDLLEEVESYNEHVARYGLFADAWRRF